MAERWYYLQNNQIRGPATKEALTEMAAAGKLAPTDSVWAEGQPFTAAVPAKDVIPFSQPAARTEAAPDWLEDVQAREAAAPPAPAVKLDWLEDVRSAEEAAQANIIPVVEESAEANLPVVEVVPVAPPAGKGGKGPPPLTGVREVAPAKKNRTPPPVPVVAPAGEPAAGTPGTARIAIGTATSRGKVRDRNEDSFLVLQVKWNNLDQAHEMAAIAVADGMGGHQAGDRASGIVIGAMAKALAPFLGQTIGADPAREPAITFPEALTEAFQEAHREVAEVAKAYPAYKGMGSTAVALLVRDGDVHIGLVGDCRVYHHRGTRLTQITRDQTIVARMVELGQLTPEEAADHPRRNEVNQAVGLRSTIEPVLSEVKVIPGDWLVVCCDGLYAHVDDRMLGEMLAQAGTSAVHLARQLVERADQLGGTDNCTVVTAYCA